MALRERPTAEREITKLALRLGQAAIFIVLLVGTALLFPRGKIFQFHYEINQITTQTIIAPFDFDILKTEEELKRDRAARVAQVKPVFIRQEGQLDSLQKLLKQVEPDLVKLRKAVLKLGGHKEQLSKATNPVLVDTLLARLRRDSLAIARLEKKLSAYHITGLKDPSWILFYKSSITIRSLFRELVHHLAPLYKQGIIDTTKAFPATKHIALIARGRETVHTYGEFIRWDSLLVQVPRWFRQKYSQPDQRVDRIVRGLLLSLARPNIRYSAELTSVRIEEARNSVPISLGKVFYNEKIVDANTRVTPEIKRKLDSLEKEYIRRGMGRRKTGEVITFLGKIALASVLYFFFFAYLFTYRTHIYSDLKLLALVSGLFLLHLGLAYLVVYTLQLSLYLIPITIAAMLFTVIFDGRIAFIAMVTLTLLGGVILSNNMPFIIANLLACSFVIYTVRRLRTRTQLLRSILAIIGAYWLVIAIYAALKFSEWTHPLENALYAAANGFFSPIISYGLLIFIERTFKITTNLTLLELLDFNHKLLNYLAVNAPGTFKHSIDVGNMAAAAADAIGANSLLARVGAYYHDVGKAEKPEYFIENQQGIENKHDKISPQLSTKIIISHVKEGLRLAREYGLPQVVADFIPMHHGRTLVEYFYQKALEKAKGRQETINDDDFRYPGPRPNTKETGILMIAEAVEAASRSIPNLTPQKLSNIIDSIIENRIKEGELSECPLTLRDLRLIKEAMLPVVLGSLHKRVEYPGQRKKLHLPDEA